MNTITTISVIVLLSMKIIIVIIVHIRSHDTREVNSAEDSASGGDRNGSLTHTSTSVAC